MAKVTPVKKLRKMMDAEDMADMKRGVKQSPQEEMTDKKDKMDSMDTKSTKTNAKKARATQKQVQKTAKLGSGARFKALTKAVAAGGAKNPAAVAAAIGRKKYGAKRFAKMAAAGRKK